MEKWSAEKEALLPWDKACLVPSEVLYHYDYPMSFTWIFGPMMMFCHHIDQKDDALFFIAVDTTSKAIDFAKNGRLSVRGLLDQKTCFVFETGYDFKIRKYWKEKTSNIPDDFLPAQGAPLYAHFSQCTDRLSEINL